MGSGSTHTWVEGMEACASASGSREAAARNMMLRSNGEPRAFTATTTTDSVCPKCGIIAKSGKISCCGHRGSWFGKCGSARNDKFDHTWYEGIEACVSREAVTRDIVIRNNGKPIVWPSNTTRQRHVSQHYTTAYYDIDGGSNAVSAKANGSGTVTTLASHCSIFLLVLVVISSYST